MIYTWNIQELELYTCTLLTPEKEQKKEAIAKQGVGIDLQLLLNDVQMSIEKDKAELQVTIFPPGWQISKSLMSCSFQSQRQCNTVLPPGKQQIDNNCQKIVIQSALKDSAHVKHSLKNEIYIDSNVNEKSLQLGTYQFPFKNFDDSFRLLFNHNQEISKNISILVKEGTSNTMYSQSMPLLILSLNITLRSYKQYDNQSFSNLAQIQKPVINIYEDQFDYNRESFGFNPTIKIDGNVIGYKIDEMFDLGLMNQEELTESKYKFHVYRSNFQIEDMIFIQENQQVYAFEDSLVKSNSNAFRWVIMQ
ncbi:UNKNOWN [Stylonychia lemnae]|uniref:Uncharacterized protein n=1 Tax=Stylonychia lemnae TaxID=5949 RepID=A0A077ZQ44_STYLE|nr:UNKNOWN [Stylonychia lemnae]|eukprot:CDW72023.1 UNKNOWN [Stylonychia lemnae]